MHDPARPGVSAYWNTPGGGIEEGESPEVAARRELFEETGINEAELGPRLWTSEREVHFPGRAMLFQETYVLMRTAVTEVSFATLEPVERRWMQTHRWWSLDELRATTEAVIPARLATLMEPLLHGIAPPAPFRIDL